MKSLTLVLLLIIGRLNVYGQDYKLPAYLKENCNGIDTTIKGFIVGSHNDTISAKAIQGGFTLRLRDTSFSVLGFNAATTQNHFRVVSCEGSRLDSNQLRHIHQPGDGNTLLFIDNIRAIKSEKCYLVKAFVCQLIN